MRRIAVFGGTGFLGQQVVRSLLQHGFAVRIATRHPDRPAINAIGDVERVRADIDDESSVAAALAGTDGAINAVSLYVEQGERTFERIHVGAATRAAQLAREAGLRQFLQISGIGADPHSTSPYIRSRGRGEVEVQAAFPSAVIIRPAVMFGPGDSFLTVIADLLRRAPLFALFGRGQTRLQPAHVDDVARAVAVVMGAPRGECVYELGGPDVLTYRALVEKVAARLGRRPVLLPVPFALWHAAAMVAEFLPGAPLTRNQVELMLIDTVASAAHPGLGALGIAPQSIDGVLPALLAATGTAGG